VNKIKNVLTKPGVSGFLASLSSIVIGIIFGYFLLLVFNRSASSAGFVTLITAGVSSTGRFAKLLYVASPLMMTGLSVGFAFKAGLFNIGATGQYLIGTFCALLGAIVFKLPWWACMLMAMAGGAVWGAFPGIFKAFFNVNEVITSIMFNWIALFSVNVLVSNIPQILSSYYGNPVKNRTPMLDKVNPSAIIPKAGLNELLGSQYVNASIFIALICAVIVYIVLNKTVFGYELKACGYNRNASVYAGINAKRNIVLSMVIAGALAGIAGSFYYLAGISQFFIEKLLPATGFNGIPVALLASSHPLGVIFSALFIAYIQVGGDALQPNYVKETIDIIISVIIYLAAFSLLMRSLITRAASIRKNGGNTESAALPEAAPPEPPAPPGEPEPPEIDEGKEAENDGGIR